MLARAASEEVSAGRLGWAIVVTALACLPLGLTLVAFLDAARRPRWAWALSRHRQLPWMIVIVLGAVTVIGGLAISSWYLLVIRPRLAGVERGELGGLDQRKGAGDGP